MSKMEQNVMYIFLARCLLRRFSLGILNKTWMLLLNVLPENREKKNVNSDLISVTILKLLKHENHQTFLVKRIGTSVQGTRLKTMKDIPQREGD